MVAKECFNQPGLQQESNDHSQDFDNEADETLSLCDLVESSNWNNNNELSISKDEYQSASDDNQDFFEFFSQDFTASSTSAYPKDSIIFCGKLIPSRSTSSKAQQQVKSSYSYRSLSQTKGYHKYSYGYDFSVKEVSTLATSAKPRWYLLTFGHGTFPSEMKMRDIKNRQRRRIPARTFRSDGGGGQIVKSSEKRSAWKGFWELLGGLGCKSQQANAVVKASFECIPHV